MAINRPFVQDPVLTAIAVAYKNQAFIADSVMPRRPVSSNLFRYNTFAFGQQITPIDTRVGRLAGPNKTEFSSDRQTAETEDYGLDIPIPNDDRRAAQGTGVDVDGMAAEFASELVAIGREQRVSNIVFSAATYPVGNKVTLSGTSQWSDFTNSDPLTAILNAMDAMVMMPTDLVLGRLVMTKLSTHPKLVKAMHGNDGDSGVITPQFLANLLGIKRVHVGSAWVNTAAKGQAVSRARLWGKHAALLTLDVQAAPQNMRTSFGYTAQWGDKVSGRIVDPNMGLRGGVNIRVGEQLREVVIASDLGYFFENAIA